MTILAAGQRAVAGRFAVAGRPGARLMLDEHMALRARLEKRVKVSDAEGVERSSARASERQLTTVVGKVTRIRLEELS